MTISSIRNRSLQRFIENNDKRGLAPDLVPRIRRVITALVVAPDVERIPGPPGWRIHRLSGSRPRRWSISVSGNWRITFVADGGDI